MTVSFWYFTNCHWSGYGTDSVHALLLLTLQWAVLLLLGIFPRSWEFGSQLGIWRFCHAILGFSLSRQMF